MLSYLKENQRPVAGASETPNGDASPDAGQNAYLTVSGHGQKLRQSTLLLLVVFGVGALGVWFMIKKTSPVHAEEIADDQVQLEAAIAQLSGMQSEMNSQMDSVVGRFYQFSTVGQIGVEELKKNPFKRELSGGQVDDDLETQRLNQRRFLEDKARRLAAGLQLWSVTATPRGICCMINDRVLYVGDTLGELTVTDIRAKGVTLELEGIQIQLKMDE